MCFATPLIPCAAFVCRLDSALTHETEQPYDTQDLDKKDAVAEKQRESMMVGLSKTKTELGSLQDALAKTQVELEKTNFELHAKKSKHMSHVLANLPHVPGSYQR